MPTDITLQFALAIPTGFATQCVKADVIYFNGGDDYLLQYWMRQYDLTKIFTGKVVATNSASSDLLATSFWTCDWRQCMDGLGILPIKFIPHYKSNFSSDDSHGPIDWQKAYDDVSLPIHALEEGKFVVIKTNDDGPARSHFPFPSFPT
ncbi:MAG TPA: hypothetical protein VNX65_00805 [Patescibacteria group bacterium]|jgi:hypothetical protein|nr:hypothetical protein [Patescibacteria group bacterium]